MSRSVSYSKISSMAICGKQVELRLMEAQRSLSADIIAGSCVDYTLTQWANGEDWKEAYETIWKLYHTREVEDQDNWNGDISGEEELDRFEEIARLTIEKYIEDINATDGTKPEITQVPLSKDMGGFILNGRVDAMWGGWLVDWKYTKNIKWLGKLQAIIYSILSGGPCRFQYHALIKQNKPSWKPIVVYEANSQEHLDRALEHVIYPAARAIEIGDFVANPDAFLCSKRYCGYWGICKSKW